MYMFCYAKLNLWSSHGHGAFSTVLILLVQDPIIEVIYADIITGKLDQKNQQLEVDYAIGRDIRTEQVTDIIQVLEHW